MYRGTQSHVECAASSLTSNINYWKPQTPTCLYQVAAYIKQVISREIQRTENILLINGPSLSLNHQNYDISPSAKQAENHSDPSGGAALAAAAEAAAAAAAAATAAATAEAAELAAA